MVCKHPTCQKITQARQLPKDSWRASQLINSADSAWQARVRFNSTRYFLVSLNFETETLKSSKCRRYQHWPLFGQCLSSWQVLDSNLLIIAGKHYPTEY
ncbi:hypothetical protein NFI96_000797 [Prochilodus magdalenae]|nr:hypothetical protein NFI96_000797 [Prochilodus magdalenae]